MLLRHILSVTERERLEQGKISHSNPTFSLSAIFPLPALMCAFPGNSTFWYPTPPSINFFFFGSPLRKFQHGCHAANFTHATLPVYFFCQFCRWMKPFCVTYDRTLSLQQDMVRPLRLDLLGIHQVYSVPLGTTYTDASFQTATSLVLTSHNFLPTSLSQLIHQISPLSHFLTLTHRERVPFVSSIPIPTLIFSSLPLAVKLIK
ncbi:hypothetical protein KAFR_0B05950 [Kazachstania africana CBS 2517]|uniref:Uncharacterized protein n=1 Tax=Kazachstania africana (strain ATCC 22294 / BCRC 22015 / CBS 2517 / CECT 1963 / NBRC 1671 / NRRL Y-8276) TaxID=1071382 RepID=H2AR91_KAZAF|nr:hypothetical protein KAFR_0B05950 [Kazachstania africana CBS 2517]CCF56891.1 hypothetical protein KAFR_0B05950 [Kazachstania africana CBS 2517]